MTRLPVSFTLNRGTNSLFLEFSQVFDVGIAMRLLYKVQLFTCFKIFALPAAVYPLLMTVFSYLAERRAPASPAGFF